MKLVLVFFLILGACMALERIKLSRRYVKYSTVHEHIQSLGAKYGFNVTAKDSRFYENNGTNLPLKDFLNLAYYGQICMGEGSQAQCFQVNFDTGSSDAWLPGTNCTSAACNKHKKFNCDTSPTCKSTGKIYSLQYGSGQVQGELVRDTFCFGGGNDSDMCVQQQDVVVTTSESDAPFAGNPYDGLVGMAYDSASSTGSSTPFSALSRQGNCPQRVFAFWMNSNPKSQDSGELSICGIDSTRYTADLVWAPVTEQKFWQFTADSVSVGSSVVVTHFEAIADTGTSLIVGPLDDILTLYKHIGVDYNWQTGAGVISCRKGMKLPNVTFTIQGTQYNVSPRYYLIKDPTSTQCLVGFGGQTFEVGLWILGDVFLRPFYTVFDLDHNRVGFAPSNGTVPDPSSATRTGLVSVTWIFALVLAIAIRMI